MMTMKKTITILLSLFMIFGLAACGDSTGQTGQTSTEGSTVEEAVNSDTTEENGITGDEGSAENPQVQQEGLDGQEAQESKVLVAYFSATNTTEGVAKNIANGLHADIYEIVPEDPYTDEDLNYHDNNSRTTIEMNDPDVRPAISGSVDNMEQYDIVFIGYPIWWGEAPRIIDTFVESYDFSGKTVIPFCTSGGSGISGSMENIRSIADGAEVLNGRDVTDDSRADIKRWIERLGIK